MEGIISTMEILDLVKYSYEQGKRVLEKREFETLKEYGQFLTPPNTASYMAKRLGQIHSGATIIEPSIGSGVLVCAVVEKLIVENQPVEIWLDAYETDKELCDVARDVLTLASKEAEQNGIKIHWQVFSKRILCWLACPNTSHLSLLKQSRRKSMILLLVILLTLNLMQKISV